MRSIVLPTVSLDGGAALRGDQITSGAIARLRFADVIEIGGGVRIAETRGMAGWSRSTTGVFQVGLHLPLDAGFRWALPIGFEVGGGGNVDLDIRFPWGFRYSAGRWFGTVSPATPAFLRQTDEPHGRWSLLVGGEVGASF